MKTKEEAREEISVLLDGELMASQLDSVFDSMRDVRNLEDWKLYHQIGDALRSQELTAPLSTAFEAQMAARLNQEPAHNLPTKLSTDVRKMDATLVKEEIRTIRKFWSFPNMLAGAAMAALAFLATPHLLVAIGSNASNPFSMSVSSSVETPPSATKTDSEQAMLRDTQVDEYLMAHQRFSPSFYSGAHYVRSASISNK